MSPRHHEGPRLWKNGFYYFDQVVGFPPNETRLRYSLKTRDPKLARVLWERERARLWDRYYGAKTGAPVGPVPMSVLIDPYAEHCRDVRKAKFWTVSRARLLMAVTAWGEDVTLTDIGPGHVRRLEEYLSKPPRPRTKFTVNHYVAVLRAFFNWAIDQGHFTGPNPMRSVKPYPVDQKRRAYSPEEMKRIVGAAVRIAAGARPQDELMRQTHRLVLLLYYTGMRLGEVLNLRWDSIKTDTIRLERTETKQRREKVIPITAPVRAILDELAGQRRDDYVLPLRRRSKSGGEYKSTWADNLIRRVRSESGVQDFLFHGLRHTASTIMAANIGKGATLRDVMTVLGHSKTETTLRYQHEESGRMKSALETIPEIEYNPPVKNASKRPVGREHEAKSVAKKSKVADIKRD